MVVEASLAVGPDLLTKGWDLAKSLVTRASDTAKYDFRLAHNAYCRSVIEKYCRVRTFFIRDDPQYLDEFYVPASVSVGKTRYERVGLETLAKLSRRVIVSGSGGSGKTILMRHLLLDAIGSGSAYPVFLELRAFNEIANHALDLRQWIAAFMSDHGFPLGQEFVNRSLDEGLLVIILDGFDEVEYSRRAALEREIKRLGSSTPCQIVLSSRPDIALEDWNGFVNTKIAPLELDEACELVLKVRMRDEEGLRQKFVDRLRGGLFNSHRYFLSNPLLLSIMMLTYGDSADIPRKSASFYEQAYIALFQKHDALKSGYRRPRKTDLDISEFARLFAAFAAITHDRRAVRFSAVDALQCVARAFEISGVRAVPAESFLDDAKQAVCLLMDDGLELAFVHRSFQEYFTARFIMEADSSIKQKYISKLTREDGEMEIQIDGVLRLLYEMAPALVEDLFLLPELRDLFAEDSKRSMSMASWRRVVSKMIDSVTPQEMGELTFTIRSWPKFRLFHFVLTSCSVRTIGRPRKDIEPSFHKDELGKAIRLRRLSDRSPTWSRLSELGAMFGIDSFEAVRQRFQEMEGQALKRKQAVESIFS